MLTLKQYSLSEDFVISNNPIFRLCFFVFFINIFCSCASAQENIIPGAERPEEYLHLLAGKNVAITANHTSMVGSKHLTDTLLNMGIKVTKIFSPEHGFRGIAGAGEKIVSSIDENTGLPIISLYGSQKKPLADDLKDIDVMVFDIQDVGVRFYTYISTLHYVMEACSESNIPLIIFDRPNPNGNYIDGPVLEPEFKSFVGMHPVPVVYGMTIAEYGLMINGEGWLKDGIKCSLEIISCKNYSHRKEFIVPLPPSPNLRNQHSIRLYPSVAFFEGTVISEGRGTDNPFEMYGHPLLLTGDHYFTPVSMTSAPEPKLKDKVCRGEDLRNWYPSECSWNKIELQWLIKAYNNFPEKDSFFNKYFFTLSGTRKLYEDIRSGKNENEIRERWRNDIENFRSIRSKYLLYPD